MSETTLTTTAGTEPSARKLRYLRARSIVRQLATDNPRLSIGAIANAAARELGYAPSLSLSVVTRYLADHAEWRALHAERVAMANARNGAEHTARAYGMSPAGRLEIEARRAAVLAEKAEREFPGRVDWHVPTGRLGKVVI